MNTDSHGHVTEVKISDFGLSRKVSDDLVAGDDSKGTLEYAAPEMLTEGKHFNERIDTWSLGVIFHQLLCGKLPFHSRCRMTMSAKIVKEELDFN